MRRLHVVVFTVMVAALWAVPALAQSDKATWGVQVGYGVGYGTVPKDTNTTRSMKPTVNGGLFAVLPFSSAFAFQPEVKYDHRDIEIGGIPTKVDYLSIPLLVRSNFLGIFMTQGIALNYVTRASVFDVDFKSALTSPDVSIVLGVGKRMGRVGVEGRWDTGMRSFQEGISNAGVHGRAITADVSVFLK